MPLLAEIPTVPEGRQIRLEAPGKGGKGGKTGGDKPKKSLDKKPSSGSKAPLDDGAAAGMPEAQALIESFRHFAERLDRQVLVLRGALGEVPVSSQALALEALHATESFAQLARATAATEKFAEAEAASRGRAAAAAVSLECWKRGDAEEATRLEKAAIALAKLPSVWQAARVEADAALEEKLVQMRKELDFVAPPKSKKKPRAKKGAAKQPKCCRCTPASLGAVEDFLPDLLRVNPKPTNHLFCAVAPRRSALPSDVSLGGGVFSDQPPRGS